LTVIEQGLRPTVDTVLVRPTMLPNGWPAAAARDCACDRTLDTRPERLQDATDSLDCARKMRQPEMQHFSLDGECLWQRRLGATGGIPSA
jgi:hypothetical protein